MLKKILALTFVFVCSTACALDKVVLITGASGDIGYALTQSFLANKHTVICQYNENKEELEKLQQKYSKQIYLLQADFNKPDKMQAFWHEVTKLNKNIDILINSAGIEKEDVSLKQIQATMNINYLSPRLICDYSVDYFKQQQKAGIIINFGSRAAYRGLPKGYYTYADSKAALTKYSQDLAKENAKANISVYVVAPGPVAGKMFNGLKDEVRAQCMNSMPSGKPVTVQEVTDMVALLASGKIPSATGGVFDLMGASWAH